MATITFDERPGIHGLNSARWTVDTLPSDWSSIRNRWEAFHARSHVHQPGRIRIRIGGSPMVT